MTTDPATSPEPEQDPDWAARCRRRLRAAMEILAEADEPIHDLTGLAAERVPLTDYDASLTKSGAVRAWNNLGWNLTTTYEHPGWLHATSEGGYRLTREGRAILEEISDPQALYEAGNAGYAAWDALRKATLPDREVDPKSEIVHAGSGAAHALGATSLVLEAWRTGGSALLRDDAVWTAERADELATYLGNNPSQVLATLPGMSSFGARVLAVEALILLMAPLSDMVGSTKRSRVRNPLVPPVDPPAIPWELSAHLEQGFVHGGQALIATPLAMLSSFARILVSWFSRTEAEQAGAFDDPWRFLDVVGPVPDADPRIAALLCVVAHPSSYTTILRPADRERIVAQLATPADELTGLVEADLKTITLRLQRESGGQPVRYDVAPLRQQWSDAPEGGSRAWLVRGEVDQQNRVPSWVAQGYVSITVGQLTHLPADVDQSALSALVEQHYGHLPVVKREGKKRDALSFVLGMQPGDLVASVDGGTLRLGRLEDSPAQLQSIGGMSLLTRRMAWYADATPEVKQLPVAVRSRLRFKGEDVLELTELASALSGLTDLDEGLAPEPEDLDDPSSADLDGDDEPAVIAPAVLACDTTELAARLHHADASWLNELLVSLNERKQVVLEGPPGTGKTYLVQRLLEACGLPEAQWALVQFHPTYSYEDFVEGFRPTQTEADAVALVIQPGPFKRLAEEAREAPGKPFVLVVDEINRANIAKVFGELYFLLEYRDFDIELLYSGGEDRFSLPDNLFIIGTMNTADRSIALLDAAMRRRFVFMSMDSDEPALSGMLHRWCAATERALDLADLRDRLNAEMIKRGLDPALAFGPSYFMRDGVDTPAGLDRLWRRELRPMLVEHHYGKHAQVDAWYPFPTWAAELATVEQSQKSESATAARAGAEDDGQPG